MPLQPLPKKPNPHITNRHTNLSTPPLPTTQNSKQTCSYDKLRVYDNADNQVIGPIDVGACSGTTQYGDAFDFAASCSDPELDAMYDAVMRWVQAVRAFGGGAKFGWMGV